jgi:hypothetical protein
MRRLFALVLMLALLAAPTASAAPPSLPPGFDDWVAQVMKAFEVPGVAITVVKDGQVVLAKGYGVRKLGDATPVDDSTLFGIASNSKVFTAVALALPQPNVGASSATASLCVRYLVGAQPSQWSTAIEIRTTRAADGTLSVDSTSAYDVLKFDDVSRNHCDVREMVKKAGDPAGATPDTSGAW